MDLSNQGLNTVLPLTLCANLSNIGFQFWHLCLLFTIVSSHLWMGASQFFCTLSNCSLKILGVLVDCFFTTTFVLPYKLMRNSMNMRTMWVDKSIHKLLNHQLLWNPFFQSLKIPWQMGGSKGSRFYQLWKDYLKAWASWKVKRFEVVIVET